MPRNAPGHDTMIPPPAHPGRRLERKPVMTKRFTTARQGFQLETDAQRLANGNHAPVLLAISYHGATRLEHRVDLPPPYEFEDAQAAAAHALEFGIRWADAEAEKPRPLGLCTIEQLVNKT